MCDVTVEQHLSPIKASQEAIDSKAKAKNFNI